MRDPIERQDAIEAVSNGMCSGWDCDVVDNLKALPSAQQWIPCSERLPEKEGWYFVTVHPDYIVPDSMHTDSLYWLDGKWWFFDYDARVAVWPDPIIAWMPLPEPYKRGEDYE